jgi:hypothetical protein
MLDEVSADLATRLELEIERRVSRPGANVKFVLRYVTLWEAWAAYCEPRDAKDIVQPANRKPLGGSGLKVGLEGRT